ncbi:MAG TPA: molybdate ABC transporter permease subunit, partial [Halomonas sp.]|nr:molybdate ABC transporter permease subunit [Halomonas sp.]
MSQLAFWRSGSTRVLPGFGLSMGISVLFISLVLLL